MLILDLYVLFSCHYRGLKQFTLCTQIHQDPNVLWVALSYTLTVAVSLTIIGRLSDIFGRRWIFIGGAVLGVVGSIVCATAQSINALIGGTAIIGMAASYPASLLLCYG